MEIKNELNFKIDNTWNYFSILYIFLVALAFFCHEDNKFLWGRYTVYSIHPSFPRTQ